MANNFRLLIQTPNKICFDEKINQIDFLSEFINSFINYDLY